MCEFLIDNYGSCGKSEVHHIADSYLFLCESEKSRFGEWRSTDEPWQVGVLRMVVDVPVANELRFLGVLN